VLSWLFDLNGRRRRLLEGARPGPLADYLRFPFPSPTSACHEVEFLAVDLETTGLDPRQDQILSVGFVSIRNLRIILAGSAHYLIRIAGQIPEQSVVIHQIFDAHAARGETLAVVLPQLLRALSGRVLVAHNAPSEMGFLNEACRRLYGCGLLAPVVDTLALERRSLHRRHQVAKPGALRLGALRARYGLPRYRAHDALSDALAAGELFLAQVEHRAGGHPLKLKRVLT
jgi:DNA polymerase-3 subunit epsilon